VRLSGKGALDALKAVFRGRRDPGDIPGRLALGSVVSPSDGRLLDRAMAVWFPGPGSFTGEDSCEIQCHGGGVVPRLVLEAAMEAGARLARPGEFTERAFLNGRMSLDQAEAVAEIVAAESEAEAAIAARALDGALADRVEPVSRGLLAAQARLTGSLDFEVDWTDADSSSLLDELAPLTSGLEELLELRRSGRVFRDGVKVVLAGPPNAGKSSLFNALLGRRRALVSTVAGTTRDYLTASVSWGRVKVDLVDTAGLRREGSDELEAMGIDLALGQIADADLVLWLRDLTLPDGGPPPDAATEAFARHANVATPEPQAANAPPVAHVSSTAPSVRPADMAPAGRATETAAGSARSRGDADAGPDAGRPALGSGKAYEASGASGGSGGSGAPRVLEAWNKCDLNPGTALPPQGALRISAATGEGLRELKGAVLELFGADGPRVPDLVPNLRQEAALSGALAALRAATKALEDGEVPEIAGILLKEARDSLDLVTGRTMTEDLLREVFSRFCLGK
jgi:tRNA modification GTPase